MNYPVWALSTFGGGFLVALIATVHVFIAHFAVGGGLFLVVTETKARREKDEGMLGYVKSHTKFFILVTMVLGGLTGIGIWLVISVLNPGATSFMIHTFVFAWATEWVCFVVEILSLLVYYYTFEKMNSRDHLRVGWIYFIFAWLSLFFIDGIISFMLTPGQWLETKSFWDGFFNPSFLPSLLFRTFMALTLAGIYGFLTSSRIPEAGLRRKMVRYCALWTAAPIVLLLPSAWWYFQVLPPEAQRMILDASLGIGAAAKTFLVLSPVLFFAGLFMALRLAARAQQAVSLGLFVAAFLYMGSFEMVRELGRRPYIIHGYMYSNGILASDLPRVRQQGLLRTARWTSNKSVTPANQVEAGEEVFRILCLPCHSVGGLLNDILPRLKPLTADQLESVLERMGTEMRHMPAFAGNAQEREALTRYVHERLR
jgi:hypothetical protein